MMTPGELHYNLARFSGSDTFTFYRLLGLRRAYVKTKTYGRLPVTFTEGVAYLVEHAECRWLLDAIVSHLPTVVKDEACESIHFWYLEQVPGGGAILSARPDRNRPAVVEQKIDYTDFPFPQNGDEKGKFSIWAAATFAEDEGQRISVLNILLPSEY